MWIGLSGSRSSSKGCSSQWKNSHCLLGLWIRPQKLSHTLNGTLFEAKQAQGFIHMELLTVKWDFLNASCALLPTSCCLFSWGHTWSGRRPWASCVTKVVFSLFSTTLSLSSDGGCLSHMTKMHMSLISDNVTVMLWLGYVTRICPILWQNIYTLM